MGAGLVAEVAAQALMHRHAGIVRQHTDRLHGLGAALGVDVVRGQCLGTGRVQPVQFAFDPQTGFIEVHHGGVQPLPMDRRQRLGTRAVQFCNKSIF